MRERVRRLPVALPRLQVSDARGDFWVVAVVGGIVGEGGSALVVLQQVGDVLGHGREFAEVG